MSRYFIRSAKYFVALCVLCTALVAFNLSSGWARLSLDETLYVMFRTPRGLLLPAMVVVLSLLYPLFGFTARRIEGDVEEDREQIETALRASGFEPAGEVDGQLRFRASGFVRRLGMLFEDEVCVSQYGQWIVVEGNRRGVARAAYRLDSYLSMKRHG